MTEKVWVVIDEYDYEHDTRVFRSKENAVEHCKAIICEFHRDEPEKAAMWGRKVDAMAENGDGFVTYADDCHVNLEEIELLP